MMLEEYLKKKYEASTAKAYQRDIEKYLDKNPKAAQAKYADVLGYLDRMRRDQSAGSVHRILQSIKKYYHYLLATNERSDHPCEQLKIRDHRNRDIQLQDLFSAEELEVLLEKIVEKNRYELLRNRNQIIISLLIYQGLTTGELVRLEVENINLEKGEIYITPSNRLNERTLALKSNQILLLHNYIQADRAKLIKIKSEKLLITQKGSEEKGEGISYLVGRLQSKYPKRKLNPKTIRQSVITNQLKSGVGLRSVQIFAGHKYPSSTERYRQNNIEELRAAIRKYHPLG